MLAHDVQSLPSSLPFVLLLLLNEDSYNVTSGKAKMFPRNMFVFRQEAFLIILGFWSQSTELHETVNLIQTNHLEFTLSAFAAVLFALCHFRQQSRFCRTLCL